MIANSRFKFVLFHVPKTGGSSLRHLYRDVRGVDRGAMGDAHITVAKFNAQYPQYKHYPKFAMKRNPWDRLASSYRHLYQRTSHHNLDKPDFRRFVHDMEHPGSWAHTMLMTNTVMRPQWEFTDGDDVEFLPFEDFENSAMVIANRFGFDPKKEVPHVNASSTDTVCEWDDSTVDIVGRVYSRDIRDLGYSDCAPAPKKGKKDMKKKEYALEDYKHIIHKLNEADCNSEKERLLAKVNYYQDYWKGDLEMVKLMSEVAPWEV